MGDNNAPGLERSSGLIVGNERIVCHYSDKIYSRGYFLGQDPFNFSTPVLMVQFVVIFVFTSAIFAVLRPFRQTLIIARIAAGIVMGPSLLGQTKLFGDKLFPPGGKLVIATFAELGFMIHAFRVGVEVDPRLILSADRKARVIGLVGYIFPLAFGGSAYQICQFVSPFKGELKTGILLLVLLNSMTSFVVISGLLQGLNILNSEIGRLALSTSIVSDVCGWVMSFVVLNISLAFELSTYKPVFQMATLACYYSIMFFLLRPLVIWITDRTPEGKPMKEGHFMAVIIILLLVGLSAECLGQHAFLGAFLFGLSLPDGPPLGEVLKEKLDLVSSAILVPIYCIMNGLKADIFSLDQPKTLTIELIIIVVYIGKFSGTIVSSLYFEIRFRDAFVLASIMCCKGIVELSLYGMLRDNKIINTQIHTLLIFSMVIVTILSTLSVTRLYDPSRRYRANFRMNIMNSQQDIDLRILSCIHNEENVYSIINLLQVTNPTRYTPISIYVLQLMELTGSAASILAPNQKLKRSTSKRACSQHIVNAFNNFEHQNRGHVHVQHFTAIAPYASMHDDICTMALDKKTSMIIVPFHRQWTIDGTMDVPNPYIRAVNQNVIKGSPCSVGILIDRSQTGGRRPAIGETSFHRIAMLFEGGADDQEALAYSIRMAEHPYVSLTVVWFKARGVEYKWMDGVKADVEKQKNIRHQEEIVSDATETIQAIRMMEGKFDLVVIGRQHEENTPVTLGFTDWSEFPELGVFGDMLATSDFTFSALVVQQEPSYFYADNVRN